MSDKQVEVGEDYNSSDDEDYVPPNECLEDEDGLQFDEVEDELVAKVTNEDKNNDCSPSQINEDPEEKKKRIDSLWEDFLSADSDQTSTNTPTPSTSQKTDCKDQCNSHAENQLEYTEEDKKTNDVEEIFSFAGKDVKINRAVPAPNSSSCSTPDQSNKRKLAGGKQGGLSAAAGLLSSKRKKLSVLDKSNHDWQEFVQKEGIKEDLSQHNRSKDSYLDKQDFLLKADYLQFQKEKDLRKTTRK
uniref:Craniofacial development protein 1 n=1 Tax=Ditylenchus dipsaci TaxID=166011 RepID=A0A915DD61_9BILA